MKTYINGHCIEQILTNVMYLTQSEYDNLSQYDKTHGSYIITDAPEEDIPASDITYDNTTSGLTADNVQEAIDEVKTELGTASTTVTQENSTGNAPYRVLLSSSYQNDNINSTTKKSSKLNFNPSTGKLNIGGDLEISGNGYKLSITPSNSNPNLFIGGTSTKTAYTRSYSNDGHYAQFTTGDSYGGDYSFKFPKESGTIATYNSFGKTATVSPSSTYPTLLSYIVNYVFNLGVPIFNISASGFSDLPSTDWGYDLCIFCVGSIYVLCHKQQSAGLMYCRDINYNSEWSGAWSQL